MTDNQVVFGILFVVAFISSIGMYFSNIYFINIHTRDMDEYSTGVKMQKLFAGYPKFNKIDESAFGEDPRWAEEKQKRMLRISRICNSASLISLILFVLMFFGWIKF